MNKRVNLFIRDEEQNVIDGFLLGIYIIAAGNFFYFYFYITKKVIPVFYLFRLLRCFQKPHVIIQRKFNVHVQLEVVRQ